jgi:hypothetical protein
MGIRRLLFLLPVLFIVGCTLLNQTPPPTVYLLEANGTATDYLRVYPTLENGGALVTLAVSGGPSGESAVLLWGDGFREVLTTNRPERIRLDHVYTTQGDYQIVLASKTGLYESIKLRVTVLIGGMYYHGAFITPSPTHWEWRACVLFDFRLQKRGCSESEIGDWMRGVENLDPGTWWLRLTVEDPEMVYSVFDAHPQYVDGEWVYTNVTGEWLEEPDGLVIFVGHGGDDPLAAFVAPLACLPPDEPGEPEIPRPDPVTGRCPSGQTRASITVELKNQWGFYGAWSSFVCVSRKGCSSE